MGSSNPFESLDSVDVDSVGISADDLNAAVEHLIQHSNEDDMVSMAKETGRDVFCNLNLADRKQKLNHVVSSIRMCILAFFCIAALGLSILICGIYAP